MNRLVKALMNSGQQLLADLENIYKDIHKNPELSMHEFRTAKLASDYIQELGFEVTREVGVTGVVGVLRNGDGPVVMLRADMDALPMTENTGLPYASTVKAKDEDGTEVGVAHTCGHDLHVTWLMGASWIFAKNRNLWKGTLMVVFQPGEEIARGAASMVQDWNQKGPFPKPDVILGQHVMVGLSGTVRYRPGVILSAGDSLKIKLFGRGSHGSQPQTAIDPVVMAAATTMRLQTIVSREISPLDSAVLTIGSLQAGTKENIIPDDATIKLNVRTFNANVREHMLTAIKRICSAECEASHAEHPPEFTPIDSYPLTENDSKATEKVAAAFQAQFGNNAYLTEPASASEDFSIFGRAWNIPYVFWFVGGTDPDVYERAKKANQINSIPSNHSPKFAPVIHPTLETGLQAMLTAASAWLCQE
jgi:amidohydrolase